MELFNGHSHTLPPSHKATEGQGKYVRMSFVALAFSRELVNARGQRVWRGPLLWGVEFGISVPTFSTLARLDREACARVCLGCLLPLTFYKSHLSRHQIILRWCSFLFFSLHHL